MTPAAFLAELESETRPAGIERLLYRMGNELTPLEIDALRPQLEQMGGTAGEVIPRSGLIGALAMEYPQPYLRTDLADGVRFFSDRRGRRSDKCLLVNFGSVQGHTLIYVSSFLQHLPADRFDVVVLADRARISFRGGFGLGPALLPAVRHLSEMVGFDAYRRVVTMGHSMGGFPALAAAMAVGADHGISLGGLYPWDVNSLLEGDSLEAFHPLCSCAPRGPELTAVYAGVHARDREHAALVERTVGAQPMPLKVRNHNVLLALAQKNRARKFLAEILKFEPRPAWRPKPNAGPMRRALHHTRRMMRLVSARRRGREDYRFLDRVGGLD